MRDQVSPDVPDAGEGWQQGDLEKNGMFHGTIKCKNANLSILRTDS